MNLFHIGSELRRFGHGKLPPLAITVIILLPLLFGGLFVWSYWDPVGKLNKLPVALVNSDTGTVVEGETVNAGEQVAETLVNNPDTDFILVSPDEALQGIEDGTYYFAIELPTDFSKAATSANSDNPHQAKLNAVYNNANGFLATMLGNQVVNQVLSTVNEKIGSQVAEQLLVGFNTISDGLHTAGDGATQLSDGTTTAADGSAQLADGTRELNSGAAQINDGAQQLASGAQELDDGIKQASTGADSLADGLRQLNDATQRLGAGAGQISQGVDQVVGVANQVATAQEQLTIPLINLSAQLRATGIPQGIQLANATDDLIYQLRTQGLGQQSEIMQQLGKLSDGAGQLTYQLSNPISDYRNGMQQATDGAAQLSTGLHQLSDGSGRLVVGTRQLADATSQLVEGTEQLTVGAAQLQSGLVQLDEGSSELALKLNESAGQVPTFGDDTIDDAATNVSTPVSVTYGKDTLSLFGVGLSPLFIALGLFMGGTVTFMVLRPLQRRALEAGATPLRAVLGSYLPAVFIGIGQATVMVLVQRHAIGLIANNELGVWIAMCFSSIVFMAITQMFNAVFGTTVGRVLCIAFMSLQIVSSGGLYPPETQPGPLRWFHDYDPMTYSVNLIRQMLFNTDTAMDHRGVQAVLIMLFIQALCLTISTLAARRERQMQFKDLHPEVSV